MIKSHVISSIVLLCLFFIQKGNTQTNGIASYYADFFVGRKMANGEIYNPNLFTCAHPTAPLGSFLKVSRRNHPGYSVIVKVSDRGPFIKGRIIDLSRRAAEELDIIDVGITDVVIAQL
ncbi:MAG TPA: septal ring lytic transglycosylase RlpA family protein [Saprospiraceae bacterium]|nr:septal ring lytic transglycosylase RlpA family protein [Saprospiraceae bacterium]